MLRDRENKVSVKAGLLALAVHAILLVLLLISFNWKTIQPAHVAEVELWSKLPSSIESQPVTPPEPKIEPVVEPKPEPPKPEPVVEPKVPEPKAEATPTAEPEVDIALAQKKTEDKLKKELEKKQKLAVIQDAARQEALGDSASQLKEKNDQKAALKKLQQEALADDQAKSDQQASADHAAANAGVIAEFQNKIRAKIHGNVNKTLCLDGNPELKFDIGLLPTGELSGTPKLMKSSGNAACDEAVERAIIASEPLPLPSDVSLFGQFRNLKLTFRPND